MLRRDITCDHRSSRFTHATPSRALLVSPCSEHVCLSCIHIEPFASLLSAYYPHRLAIETSATPPRTPESTLTAIQPPIMDRIRQIFERENSTPSYEPLEGGSERLDGEHIDAEEQAFSWTDYAVFTLLGVAMLWAWYVLIHPTTCRRLTSAQEHVLSSSSLLPATLRIKR